MIRITRIYTFSASHRLHSARLTPEQNARVFGKCNNPFGHGHNYRLHVAVEGDIDPQTGMVAPPAVVDGLVSRAVLDRLDHRNLNSAGAGFEDLVPTTENLGRRIVQWLQEGWADVPAGRLAAIRLEETGSNTIEIELL